MQKKIDWTQKNSLGLWADSCASLPSKAAKAETCGGMKGLGNAHQQEENEDFSTCLEIRESASSTRKWSQR